MITTPIGKSFVTDDFKTELANLDRAIYIAKVMGSPYIRVFSFYAPEGQGQSLDSYADEVIGRLGEMTRIAEKAGITLGLENETDLFGDNIARNRLVFDRIRSPYLRLIFDVGNFIRSATVPYPDAYEALKGDIGYFHIKDRKTAADHFLPPGEGDGQIGAMLKDAYDNGFDGWLSVEPHLSYRKELNMAQQFTVATNALKRVLNEWVGTNLSEADPAVFS